MSDEDIALAKLNVKTTEKDTSSVITSRIPGGNVIQ